MEPQSNRFTASRARRIVGFPVLAAALLLLLPEAVSASITTPEDGATVRGDVSIHEDRGGQRDFVCGLSGAEGADSTITATSPEGVEVFRESKGGPGSWTAVWVTHGLPLGEYTLRSEAVDLEFDFATFSCQPRQRLLSEITVTVENLSSIAYTGDTEASVILPFVASAELTDATTGRPIEGRGVTFLLNGSVAGVCVTGADGTCATLIPTVAAPGEAAIEAVFEEDCCWLGSSDEAAIDVTLLPACLDDGPLSCLPEPPDPDDIDLPELPGAGVCCDPPPGSTQ